MVGICVRSEPPCFRKFRKHGKDTMASGGAGDLGDSVHKRGERGEDLTDFPGMFEPIIIAFSVAVVAHHIGQAERAQYIAHARHASANSAGDLVGV